METDSASRVLLLDTSAACAHLEPIRFEYFVVVVSHSAFVKAIEIVFFFKWNLFGRNQQCTVILCFAVHPHAIVLTRVKTAKNVSTYVISLQLTRSEISSVKTFLTKEMANLLHWLTLDPLVCREIFMSLFSVLIN